MMRTDRADATLARRALLAAAPFALIAPQALAQEPMDRVRSDSGGRLTTPVRINGSAPLAFAVDSAANASVLASDLLDRLGLVASGTADINTLIALETVPVATADLLTAGEVQRTRLRLMIADREGLGGVDGLLGTDVLAGHRLTMQFVRRRMRLSRSRTSNGYLFSEGRSTLRYRAPADQRFNNLMMISGTAGAQPFHGILDTGAGVSIINRAMAQSAGASPITLDDGRRGQIVRSPTGLGQQAEAMMLPILGFGGVTLRRVPVLAGDFHCFDLWGLADRPAMLIGVDVLGRFKTVAIDLGRSELLLEP